MGMQVLVGDVIYVEANSGAVKRVGRSDAFATEFDLEAEEYVPLPKGEVHKKKEIVQVGIVVALHLYTNPIGPSYNLACTILMANLTPAALCCRL